MNENESSAGKEGNSSKIVETYAYSKSNMEQALSLLNTATNPNLKSIDRMTAITTAYQLLQRPLATGEVEIKEESGE